MNGGFQPDSHGTTQSADYNGNTHMHNHIAGIYPVSRLVYGYVETANAAGNNDGGIKQKGSEGQAKYARCMGCSEPMR